MIILKLKNKFTNHKKVRLKIMKLNFYKIIINLKL